MIAARSTETRHAGLRPAEANLAHFPAIEATEFRNALRNLASGVAIVATGVGEARRGLTASSVTSICADPPCLLVGVNTKSEAHDSILANGYFGISLLRAGQEALARRFAGSDGVSGADRFGNSPWSEGLTGAPLLDSAICAIDCVLQQHQIVGSHGIFIGRIVATRQLGAGNPVINFQGELRSLPLT
jgi:flavin reductase (DIM6/NTAB) family NADH-FMN oxidoreductase RutF